jgi:hypothetical protein
MTRACVLSVCWPPFRQGASDLAPRSTPQARAREQVSLRVRPNDSCSLGAPRLRADLLAVSGFSRTATSRTPEQPVRFLCAWGA